MSEVNDRVRGRMIAHGFPAGLLPDCITADEFDESTGAFVVTLGKKVQVTIDGFPVHYAKTITGIIKPDRIQKLKGVKAKKGLWIPITGIQARADDLLFLVGPIKQPVSRAAFQ